MAQSNNAEPEILIVAAEASSALYAQRLLEYWKKQNFKVKSFGIGSRDMESLGFEIIGRSEELAVVGLTEVIKHYSHIKSVFYNLLSAAENRKPQAILLLDYPDFNLRLAKKLKPLGIPIIYYISPQIWAWRKSRINIIKKYIDKMLVLLPFEKKFYSDHGVDVEFVGHPLLDELGPELFDKLEFDKARSRYGILPTDTWVGLMPGSRHSEIKHHLLGQLAAAEKIYEQHPEVKFALLVAPTFNKQAFQNLLPHYKLPLTLIKDEPLKMVSIVDLVLCASGTATLIVGLLKKPMVIMYKMNRLSAFLARLFVRGTQHFGLINLVLNKRAVPELFQNEASTENLAREMVRYIENKDYKIKVIEDLAQAQLLLGSKGATVRVAGVLKPYLEKL